MQILCISSFFVFFRLPSNREKSANQRAIHRNFFLSKGRFPPLHGPRIYLILVLFFFFCYQNARARHDKVITRRARAYRDSNYSFPFFLSSSLSSSSSSSLSSFTFCSLTKEAASGNHDRPVRSILFAAIRRSKKRRAQKVS